MDRRFTAAIVNYEWDDDDGQPRVNAREDCVRVGYPWRHTQRGWWSAFCDAVRDDPTTNLALPD